MIEPVRVPNPPTVAYDAAYVEDHAAGDASPERELWRAVLRQAADDLFSSNEQIRADAIAFFESDHLLLIMDLAGINRDDAPWLRSRAKELAEVPPDTPRPKGKHISYQGQTRSLKGWAEVTGLSVFTLGHRLKPSTSTQLDY